MRYARPRAPRDWFIAASFVVVYSGINAKLLLCRNDRSDDRKNNKEPRGLRR